MSQKFMFETFFTKTNKETKKKETKKEETTQAIPIIDAIVNRYSLMVNAYHCHRVTQP
jgi:hypothetical protein